MFIVYHVLNDSYCQAFCHGRKKIVSVEKSSIFGSIFLRDDIGMPSEFLIAQNVEVSCNMHVNLFSNLAAFLLYFEAIKRLLFVNKSFTQDKKRTLYNIRKSFTQYKNKLRTI